MLFNKRIQILLSTVLIVGFVIWVFQSVMIDKEWRLYMPELRQLGENKEKSEEVVVITPLNHKEETRNEMMKNYWTSFHTTLANYPSLPTLYERNILFHYIVSSASLFPCGECSVVSQKLIRKYPPQTGSSKAATAWGCKLHGKFNEEFNLTVPTCDDIATTYVVGSQEIKQAENQNDDERSIAYSIQEQEPDRSG
ncbi:sulfhydryl oxidase [Schizosaccharomyces cryophilus OY26]|uniref:Sulfhydryl oxidase n=1 Tax=Schizosaccharomyces cryophilus (strain OY26 / ATCC MYA-4695 / CBS 11777 / NBRC 106824 / NRRL Y48691) TaxID=653667 RepID=S9X6N9_SCHCR|nr:sulfhydryl oxidase [Schizosaccharomyces cryophilus OY26]EPY49436.1 sulfhydryl oxidase [Schizosaccharomyces cryophilus OY26]